MVTHTHKLYSKDFAFLWRINCQIHTHIHTCMKAMKIYCSPFLPAPSPTSRTVIFCHIFRSLSIFCTSFRDILVSFNGLTKLKKAQNYSYRMSVYDEKLIRKLCKLISLKWQVKVKISTLTKRWIWYYKKVLIFRKRWQFLGKS